MNFQDLLAKMKSIDESEEMTQVPTVPGVDNPSASPEASVEECGDGDAMDKPAAGDMLFGEKGVEECGLPGMSSMPSGMMGTSKQQDNVTMNVSMNGSGAGGIRDLMDIIRNLDDRKSSDHALMAEPEIVVGVEESDNDGGFGQATTEPDEHTYSVDSVTGKGNDLHSQGDQEVPKVNGGGNPLAETLMARLSAHYQSIKEKQ
jgi:hypothetical protein